VYRALNFECEDILLDLLPEAERYRAAAFEGEEPPKRRRIYSRFQFWDKKPEIDFGPGDDIDLLVVNCMTTFDLRFIPGIDAALKKAKQSVLYITEIWSGLVHRDVYDVLGMFDKIASGCVTSVDPIAETAQRPTFYCPPALDATTWSANDAMPQRLIDVMLFGRKHNPWHEALREQSQDEGYFYQFDTVHGSQPISLQEHREHFRELNWRSKINIVNIAKVNMKHERGSDEEIGFRFFEATAAGCVLVGYRPNSRYWEELFGWQDSIFNVPLDEPAQLTRVVRSLLDDPDRMQEVSIRNRAEFLRRHDAVYRWEQIFQELGHAPTNSMLQRKQLLADQADGLMQKLEKQTSPAHTNV
jgi:hypothetical protein